MNTIAIEDKLLERFHLLARETHRPEAEIINEALSSYLDRDALYVEVLRQRLDAADRGEFAGDQQVDHFYTTLSD
jgi:predicted transcriptional regulator